MLVASIATGLQVGSMEPKIATAAFMGLRDWQFRGAVFFGDTIRVKRTIGEKTEHPKSPKQGFVIYEVEVAQPGRQGRPEGPVEHADPAARGLAPCQDARL